MPTLTPVIVNDCHSQPELIIEGKTGEISKTGYKQWTPGGGFVYYPDTQSLYEKMELMYARVTKEENKITTDCRNWIVSNYSIDTLYKEKWVPFLEKLQDEFLPIDPKAKKA